jgi:hypothetical protein
VRIFLLFFPIAKPRSFNSKNGHQVVSNLSDCGGNLEFLDLIQEFDFNPNHNQQLASQLCSFDAVIAETTTLILESVCLGKPTAVILCDDLKHQTHSLRVWNNFAFYRRLEELEGFFVIKSKEDIESFLSSLNRTNLGMNYLSLKCVVGPIDGSYVSRLAQTISPFIGAN